MRHFSDAEKPKERVELTGFLAEFRDALEEEIDKIKKSGQSSTLLFGGRQIESHGPDLWYRFNVEYVPSLPADTPCKLVVGYAGDIYHAWISVWTEDNGWVDGAIFFDGHAWKRMDPTFASSGHRSAEIMEYIENGNYTVKYLY